MPTFLRRRPTLVCGLCLALLLCRPAAAQSVTGSITGAVTDASGGVLVGATVTLVNEKTGERRNVNTNEDGRFNFAAVQPGVYTVRVEQQGFQTLERKNTTLSANESLALGELALPVGQVTEVVTTVASGTTVETASSDLTARLTADQISLISTKGRDITSLLRLMPGTSNNDDIEGVGDGFGTDLPNVSGQRGRSAVASVDGLNAGEPSGSNKLSMTINQDAVAEVQVLRDNYGAEYGNNGGALINLVSKGGGREYRGTAYYFLRNEALNASNFFSNKAGLKRPLYRHNIWGGNFGGPLPLPRFGEGGRRLVRDKAFFFFSVEKPHTITPTDPVFVTVPTALERAGDFSQSINSSGARVVITDPLTGQPFPNNVIPAGRLNRSGLALLNYYPLPNANGRTAGGASYNYVNQLSQDTPKHSYLIRFDFKPSDRDSIYFKAQWWTSDNEGLGTSGWPNGSNGVDRWGISSHYLYTDDGRSANWVHVFDPAVVNEFTFGWRDDTEGFVPSDGFAEGLQRSKLNYTAPQLFPDNNTLGLIPRATGWSSVAGNPANINWLDRWGEVGADHVRPSFSDNLSWNRGGHGLKFGAYYERLFNREAPGGQWSGVLDFGTSTSNGFTTAAGNTNYAYANALLGNFNSYTEQRSRPFTNEQITLFQWYAQDQWKVSRRLNVNYGMRFGYHSPFFQLDGQGSNFDPAKFNPANAPLLYHAYCVGQPGGVPALGTACAAANQRAVDPRNAANPTAAQLLPARLVRSYVPNAGNILEGLALPDDPSTPKGYRHTAPVDFEPRVGFAWDLFGGGKTVLRGMGGIYHAPRIGGGTGGASSLGNNPPQQRSFTIQNGQIDQLVDLVGTALNFPTTLSGVEASSKTPASYNYTLGLQRDVGFKTVVEVSYVGSFARHLGERRNINALPDGAKFVDCRVIPAALCHAENRDPLTAASAKNNDFLRPYRGYGDINVVTWSGTSNYNSMQVQVNRRYTQGFQFGAAYTYSKSFDYANDDTSDLSAPRPYRAFNYAPSDFDQTHIATFYYIYDVPGLGKRLDNKFVGAVLDHWQVSGITSYASGKPKNLSATYTAGTATISSGQTCPPGTFQTSATVCTMITDFTGGTVNARAVVVCDPMKGVSGSDPTGTPFVINTGCFAAPTALGQIGNMPRNSVRMPSIFNTDFAFFKNIPLGESRGVQLRWEMYNLFNRANFRDIDGAMTFGVVQVNPGGGACSAANVCTAQIRQTRTTFGTPTSARAPRVMQASLRINF
jgi:hypothetical protein